MGYVTNGSSIASVSAAGITDAGTTGIALVQSATPAAALAVVLPYVAVTLASSSGWTTSVVGSSSATGWTGSVVLATGSSANDYVATGRVVPEDAQAVEVLARISATTASASDHLVSLVLGSDTTVASRTASVSVTVTGAGVVSVASDGGSVTGVSVAGVLGGQGWLRLVVRGGNAQAWAGVGSGGALPTSWTPVGSVSRGNSAPWAYAILQAYTLSGTFSATVNDLRARALP